MAESLVEAVFVRAALMGHGKWDVGKAQRWHQKLHTVGSSSKSGHCMILSSLLPCLGFQRRVSPSKLWRAKKAVAKSEGRRSKREEKLWRHKSAEKSRHLFCIHPLPRDLFKIPLKRSSFKAEVPREVFSKDSWNAIQTWSKRDMSANYEFMTWAKRAALLAPPLACIRNWKANFILHLNDKVPREKSGSRWSFDLYFRSNFQIRNIAHLQYFRWNLMNFEAFFCFLNKSFQIDQCAECFEGGEEAWQESPKSENFKC